LKITLEITPKRIADIMCAAVEQNHMTRAWCAGVLPVSHSLKVAEALPYWYANALFYNAPDWQFEVLEILDESKEVEGDNIKRHLVTPKVMGKGITYMAEKHGHHFAAWLAEDEDAITADVFLQCIAMREVKYG
jgi:hypothetical protein